MSQLLFPGWRRTAKVAGKQSQRSGAAHQVFIERSGEAAGIRFIEVPPPVRILGTAPAARGRKADPRVVLARLEKPVCVDFLGALPRSGRSVALEAKTATPTQHPTSYALCGRLRGHQGDMLASWHEQGAVACVVLRRLSGWTPAGKRKPSVWVEGADYVVPWPLMDPRPERVSWAWESLERWRVPVGRGWCEVLSEWERYLEEGWL